jgi:hypothetical protein
MSGQFLSVDPKVQETLEEFIYAGDDPVNGTDPSGLGPDTMWWIYILTYKGVPYYVGKTFRLTGLKNGTLKLPREADHIYRGRFGNADEEPEYAIVRLPDPVKGDQLSGGVETRVIDMVDTNTGIHPENVINGQNARDYRKFGEKDADEWLDDHPDSLYTVEGVMRVDVSAVELDIAPHNEQDIEQVTFETTELDALEGGEDVASIPEPEEP